METSNVGDAASTTHLVSPDTKARMYNIFQHYKLKLQYEAEARVSSVMEPGVQVSVTPSVRRAYDLARERFIRENPGFYPPSRTTLERYEENLRLYNSFLPPRVPRTATVRTPEVIEKAKNLLAETPTMSMTELGSALGVDRMSAHRIVKRDLKFKSYKKMSVQELLPRHNSLRFRQAKVFKYKVFDTEEKLMLAIFTDEVRVDNAGNVMGRRRVYAASAADLRISDLIQQHVLHGDSAMAWMGFSALLGVIGPFFFPKSVNQKTYCDMLRHHFQPALEAKIAAYNDTNSTELTVEQFFFVQDNAPAHYAVRTKEMLLDIFGDKDQIIGGHRFHYRWVEPPYEPYAPETDYWWPPMSCDLMMNDFWAHGVLKRFLLNKDISSQQKIMERIREWAAQVTTADIYKACGSFQQRLDLLILAKGKHIEPYLRWPALLARDRAAAEAEERNARAAAQRAEDPAHADSGSDDDDAEANDFLAANGWGEGLIQVDLDSDSESETELIDFGAYSA